MTKGRFKPANDTSMEPALYLHLIAETSEALERATERINQIMQSGASVVCPFPYSTSPFLSTPPSFLFFLPENIVLKQHENIFIF